jgi:hypothetical protein
MKGLQMLESQLHMHHEVHQVQHRESLRRAEIRRALKHGAAKEGIRARRHNVSFSAPVVMLKRIWGWLPLRARNHAPQGSPSYPVVSAQ